MRRSFSASISRPARNAGPAPYDFGDVSAVILGDHPPSVRQDSSSRSSSGSSPYWILAACSRSPSRTARSAMLRSSSMRGSSGRRCGSRLAFQVPLGMQSAQFLLVIREHHHSVTGRTPSIRLLNDWKSQPADISDTWYRRSGACSAADAEGERNNGVIDKGWHAAIPATRQ